MEMVVVALKNTFFHINLKIVIFQSYLIYPRLGDPEFPAVVNQKSSMACKTVLCALQGQGTGKSAHDACRFRKKDYAHTACRIVLEPLSDSDEDRQSAVAFVL